MIGEWLGMMILNNRREQEKRVEIERRKRTRKQAVKMLDESIDRLQTAVQNSIEKHNG